MQTCDIPIPDIVLGYLQCYAYMGNDDEWHMIDSYGNFAAAESLWVQVHKKYTNEQLVEYWKEYIDYYGYNFGDPMLMWYWSCSPSTIRHMVGSSLPPPRGFASALIEDRGPPWFWLWVRLGWNSLKYRPILFLFFKRGWKIKNVNQNYIFKCTRHYPDLNLNLAW